MLKLTPPLYSDQLAITGVKMLRDKEKLSDVCDQVA